MPRYYVAWFSISMAIRIFPNPSFYAIDKHFRRTQLSAKYSIVKHILHVCHYDYYRALCPPHAWTWPRATQTQPPLIWKLLLTISAPSASAPSEGEPVHFAWILGIFIPPINDVESPLTIHIVIYCACRTLEGISKILNRIYFWVDPIKVNIKFIHVDINIQECQY